LVFVPLTLAVAAPLVARAARGWRDAAEARLAAVALFVLTLVGVAAPSYLVKDNGFAIFALPVIVAAFAAYLAAPAGRRPGLDLALAAFAATPALAGLLLWVLGYPDLLCLVLAGASAGIGVLAWWRSPAAAWLAPMTATAILLAIINILAALGDLSSSQADLGQALQADNNRVRLFAVLGPARLAGLGTRTADAMQDTDEHMRDYGATLTGRGYFNLPTPTVLKPYHLTDNVSAVHLISPFGRLGALGYLLIWGGLAAAACFTALRRSRPSTWLGALAALTVALVSAYMILANLLAAPFTGRNVYLLAASSSADLLEGLLLVALVAAALGARRRRPA
jgi:hypothetical protein